MMSFPIQNCLANMLDINEERYRTFCKERLERCDIPITDVVKCNVLHLPSSMSEDTKKVNRVQQAKNELKFGKSIQVASQYRDDLVKECFEYEVTEYPSSLTTGCRMYHSSKADLLIRFRNIEGTKIEDRRMDNSAIVVDLSVIVNALSNRKSITPRTFGDFSLNYLHAELMELSRDCPRLDIVTDSYPEGTNLKESLQMERGIGKRIKFNDDTEFPANFASDFLRNSDNKREFYPYVVDKIISKSEYDEKIVVATRNEQTVTNYKANILGVSIPDCSHIEADTRIILHVLNCIHSGIQNIIVRSVDTDVVILLIAYMQFFLEMAKSTLLQNVV